MLTEDVTDNIERMKEAFKMFDQVILQEEFWNCIFANFLHILSLP